VGPALTSSQQSGGAQAVSITYSANGAIASDALGATHTYTFTNDPNYAPRASALSINALTQTFTVPAGATDPQRRVTQSVDANGNITASAYDSNHLTSKTEASGTLIARTTSYQYLSTLSALPTLITEPLRQTSYQYYSGTNNVQYKTVTDTTVTPNVARTWTYTYDTYGRVLTVQGPRTDVSSITTTAYYTCTTGSQCGEIETVSNAVGQVTTYNTYNAYGQPLTITDPNGVVTTLTYDARQRLTSRQIGTETTSYSYYPTGLLNVVTSPDGSTMTSTYDGAHRLTDITDGLGNHVHYTLDAMGNHAAENTYDPSNTLRRTHTRVINALNQLYQDINAAGTAAVTTTFTYDNDGNQTAIAAPLSRNASDQYDALSRLTQITDPNSGVTQFSYDANNNLASVKDPRSLTTTYSHDGFGDVTQQVSPDTGTTISTYDSGGNLKTATDARGAVATYSYDALNRVTQAAYTDQTISFTYDAGTNGKGRLTGASDANHSLAWTYDTHGRVTGKAQIVGSVTKSVGYAYANDDMTSIVTPSGQTITYGYTNHQITSIAVNGATLLSGVTYFPYGPPSAWTWGNGTGTIARTYDQDGKITSINSAADVVNYGYDNAFRITSIADTGITADSWTVRETLNYWS
jgi:YD repeat-containing protein